MGEEENWEFTFDWLDKSPSSPNSLSTSASSNSTASTSSRHEHRRGLEWHVGQFLNQLKGLVDIQAWNEEAGEWVAQSILLQVMGKRNVRKVPVEAQHLSYIEQAVYRSIEQQMSYLPRRQRILEFMQDKEITRRLVNYFVVHYAFYHEMSYYLDRRTYPYRILGQLNEPNQPDILKLIESGANIVWINFHQAYKNSKNQQVYKNRQAPYQRSTSVLGEDGMEYSLCAFNFYLWLDSVGGFDLFRMMEADIRKKKIEYDKQHRQDELLREKGQQPKRKHKVGLKHITGENYRTLVVQVARPAPFCAFMS